MTGHNRNSRNSRNSRFQARLAALLVAIVLSCVTQLNVGILGLGFAWIVGVYVAGMSLNDVIRAATVNPAKAIRRPDLGTLKVGSVGDAVVLDHRKGKFEYMDVLGETLVGKHRLVNAGMVLPLAIVMFPRLVQSAAREEKTNLLGMVLLGILASAPALAWHHGGHVRFGIVVGATGSYRQAILSLIVLLVAGLALLVTTDTDAAARQAALRRCDLPLPAAPHSHRVSPTPPATA